MGNTLGSPILQIGSITSPALNSSATSNNDLHVSILSVLFSTLLANLDFVCAPADVGIFLPIFTTFALLLLPIVLVPAFLDSRYCLSLCRISSEGTARGVRPSSLSIMSNDWPIKVNLLDEASKRYTPQRKTLADPYYYIGGIWTNVEDEILKVAVMKYGLNQWARISSLLVRKTPKQCKARWNEWLDPRIRKTEWSKEEDEKLLHLAKVFPSQWGTISDMVGRTSQMCLERYEKLLDEASAAAEAAETKETREEAGTTTVKSKLTLAEAKKLKPGEVDPSPETKPARPDPVDMDEDEKEMLAEARARLHNTMGKKQKRKARQKLIEEARRSAALLKRKELIAAGLPGIAFKHRGLNYNAEIPFERKPVPGLHNVTEELREEAEQVKEAAREKQARIRNKDAIELAERKKDVQKEKGRMEKGLLPLALERKLREQQTARKAPLNLPAPQITEADLEQLAKLGYHNLVAGPDGIPATPASGHPIMTPLHHTSSSRWRPNDTPMSSTMSTYSNTTSTGKTPIRDYLGINASVRSGMEPMDSASLADVVNKNRLRNALKSLPKPKNEFDIVL